jgi:hypothetical protein
VTASDTNSNNEMASNEIRPSHDARMNVSVHLCIPEDQEHLAPKRRRAPRQLPPDLPLPRVGEAVYLSSSSAWVVSYVIHEWRTSRDLRIEIWLNYAGAGRYPRSEGFTSTQ